MKTELDSSDGLLEPEEFGITRLPKHIAIIMDGNGRWAQERGQIRLQGHKAGAESVRSVLRTAYRLGVKYLTLYAFSEQNWARPEDEVKGLMSLLVRHVRSESKELMQRGIRFRAIGDVEKLSPEVLNEIRGLEEQSKENDDMFLQVAISYGSREEIVHACKQLAEKVQRGELKPEDITEKMFSQNLYTAEIPDPDLMIRTSGEMRVSNFLLWQLAYGELYVTDTYWPDFHAQELVEALRDYSGRERRFGKTGAQIQKGRT